MTVQQIVDALGLKVLSGDGLLERAVSGGYASDLLSYVMAKAQPAEVWVTLQAHPNVVAVASLTDVACVIITEGIQPDEVTLAKARQEGVILLGTNEDTFRTVARLAALGLEG
jgi:predicted transcriptional regulator